MSKNYKCALVFCSSGRVETIDARETAPMNATVDMFGNNTKLSRTGTVCLLVLLECFPDSGIKKDLVNKVWFIVFC